MWGMDELKKLSAEGTIDTKTFLRMCMDLRDAKNPPPLGDLGGGTLPTTPTGPSAQRVRQQGRGGGGGSGDVVGTAPNRWQHVGR